MTKVAGLTFGALGLTARASTFDQKLVPLPTPYSLLVPPPSARRARCNSSCAMRSRSAGGVSPAPTSGNHSRWRATDRDPSDADISTALGCWIKKSAVLILPPSRRESMASASVHISRAVRIPNTLLRVTLIEDCLEVRKHTGELLCCRVGSHPGPKETLHASQRIREETAQKTVRLDVEILARPGGSREKRLLERIFIFLSPGDSTAGSNAPPFCTRRRIALARVATASSASWEGALKVNFSDLGSPRLSRFRRVFRTSLLLSVRAQARSSRNSLGLGSIGLAFSPSCLTFRTSSIVRREEKRIQPAGL